jgi:hypothetical protein
MQNALHARIASTADHPTSREASAVALGAMADKSSGEQGSGFGAGD